MQKGILVGEQMKLSLGEHLVFKVPYKAGKQEASNNAAQETKMRIKALVYW